MFENLENLESFGTYFPLYVEDPIYSALAVFVHHQLLGSRHLTAPPPRKYTT